MLVAEKAIVDDMQDTLYSIGLDGYSFKNSLALTCSMAVTGIFPVTDSFK